MATLAGGEARDTGCTGVGRARWMGEWWCWWSEPPRGALAGREGSQQDQRPWEWAGSPRPLRTAPPPLVGASGQTLGRPQSVGWPAW